MNILCLFTQYNLLALIFRFTNQPFTHSYLHARPVELLRETKRDFNFPYIYHKGEEGRRGQFEPLDADLTWSAFTSPTKPVAYWITRHLPLMRPNSRYWRYWNVWLFVVNSGCASIQNMFINRLRHCCNDNGIRNTLRI